MGEVAMDWLNDIDWYKLKNPPEPFELFMVKDPTDPKDPFYGKVAKLQTLLKKRPLWLSDEYRTPQAIEAITRSYFTGYTFNIFYEAGDFQALIGFMDIHPAFKCEMTLKLIDPKIWGRDFVRAGQKLIHSLMDEFRLKRISIETADRRIVRMAEMVGFIKEGERPNDLRWDGKFYDKYFLGLYEENGETQ